MNKLLSLMPYYMNYVDVVTAEHGDVELRNSFCLRRPALTPSRAKQGSKSISDCARHPHAQFTSEILGVRLCVGNVFDSTLRTSNQAEEAQASRPFPLTFQAMQPAIKSTHTCPCVARVLRMLPTINAREKMTPQGNRREYDTIQ